MAFLTAAQQQDAIRSTVGVFNAAPGGYFGDLANLASPTGVVGTAFYEALEATSIFRGLNFGFSSGSLPANFATAFANQILGTTVSAANMTVAVGFVTSLLAAGQSRGAVMRAAVDFLSNSANSTDANFGTAVQQFINRASVASFYTINLSGSSTSLSVLQGTIASVDSTAASVTAANTANSGVAAPTGTTFTLTTGMDDATGKTAVTAFLDALSTGTTVTTWGVTDQVSGTSATTDTMTVSVISDGFATPVAKTFSALAVSGIETITFKHIDANTLANSTTVDAASFTGVTRLKVDGSTVVNTTGTDTIAFTGLVKTAVLELGANSANLNITVGFAGITGTADTANVAVGGRNGTLTLTTGIETVALTASGTAARLAGLTTTTATAVTVAGTGLKIDGIMDATIKTFDASTSTGTVNVYLATGTTLTSAKGGTGTADVLAVDSLQSTTTLAGFETLIAQGAAGTYDLTNAVGVTTLGVDVRAVGPGDSTFTNAAATQATIAFNGAAQRTTGASATASLTTGGAVTYGLKTNTGTADALTLAFSNGGTASSGTVTVGGTTTATAVEIVNITAADWKGVTLTGITQTGSGTAVLSVVAAATAANLTLGAINQTHIAAATVADIIDLSLVTGTTSSSVTGTGTLIFSGGTGVDTVTGNGIVIATMTQTYNLGAGNDIFTTVAITDGTLAINAGAGDDTITIGATQGATGILNIGGGDGTDLLVINSDSNYIDSLVGVEKITNISSTNALLTTIGVAAYSETVAITQVGAGDITFVQTAAGTVSLAGVTFVGIAPTPLTLSSFGSGTNTLTGASVATIIVGGSGVDTITGGAGIDTITGLGGNDIITGGGAADIITGGAGKDTITAAAGQFTYAAGVADTVATATSIAGVDLLVGTFNTNTSARIDTTVTVATVHTAVTGALTEATFVANMNTLLNVAGGAGFDTATAAGISSAQITATSGDLNGRVFLAIDLDASDTFTATDFVVEITGSTMTSLTTASFF